MVTQSDIPRINALAQELATIDRAIANLEAGGPITQMTAGVPPGSSDPAARAAAMSTGYMQFPPQMIAGIKQQAGERRAALQAQLKELGVTVEEPEPHPPQQQQHPRGQRDHAPKRRSR